MELTQKLGAAASAAALSLGASALAQDAVQWRVADGGNGHWYGRSESVLNWDNARIWAVAHGGDLASITSDAERDAVLAIGTDCWIGARKLPGMAWEWSDGTPWGYTMWCPGEPCCGDAGLYVHANSTGCWDDHNQARASRLGLIEWSADCNNDGIVDFGQIRAGELADANLDNVPDCCARGGTCDAAPVEWSPAQGGNGHWYQVDEELRDWADAKAFCESRGGHLATVHSSAENAFILEQALPWNNDFWLGATRTADPCGASCFTWVTGEPWTHAAVWNQNDSWGCDAPNPNNCGWNGPGTGTVLELSARPMFGAGTWNDESPTLYFGGNIIGAYSIIEWSADCNNDGIVDFGQIRAGTLADVNLNNIPDTCESGGGTNAPQQWSVASGGNGHWYAAVATPKPIIWSEARDAAAGQGGHLATLNSQAEDSFVSAIAIADATAWPLADRYGPWLGGYQTIASDNPHANWAWVTGEPWSYVSGLVQFDNSSRPDGQHDDYLHYIDHSAIWNDVREDGDIYYGIGIRSYLIEWSADCNSDGIVDFGQIRAGELDDANHNNIPDCCEGAGSCNCPGDVARDGVVNGIDLAAVLNNWGTGGGAINADANGDGIVDAEDLALVLSNWGDCP